ncbi:MAG: isoprenyl transferase [Candidatus Latescibacterota bacterium]|nr:isoprenyl transferase [Candidatus Latescibacterota bacterium]
MTTTPEPHPERQTVADRDRQQRLRHQGAMPRHVAIIMDGDRRWAKERALKITEGHRHGRESVRDIVRACGQLEIEALTLYTFSSENWNRPRHEVAALMHWLEESLRDETPELHENDVRLSAIGRLDALPDKVRRALDNALAETAHNTGLCLNLALNYGGRAELVDACRTLARRVRDGALDPDAIDEAAIDQTLYTAGLPDPDLLIRCSGEMRLSNFLPWQMVYTEIYFTPVFWPDFRRHHLYEAVREFQRRQRRFGA